MTSPPKPHRETGNVALRWNERALLSLLRLGCATPVRLLLVLARLASWPLAKLARGRHRVVLANLRLCLPDWDAGQRTLLADRNLRSTAVSLVENLIAWYAPKSHVDVHVEGAEHLQRALSEGRGAILLTPHFTMIEMVPRALSLAANGAWQLSTVVRRHNAPSAEAVIDAGRRRWSPTIDKKDVRGMLRALKNNRALISAPDQNFSYGSVFAPFFGVPAATTTGNIRLAKSAGCPTLPCMVRRLPGGRSWQVRIDPPLESFPSADALADATRSNAMVEAEVRLVPEQYLWAHRRFRSRPDGEQSLYDDDVLKRHHREQAQNDAPGN